MLKKYKDWLFVNNNSQNTVRNYVSKVRKFLKKVKINDINEENINHFFVEIKEKYKPSTVNTYRASIKSLLDFLKKDIPLPKSIKSEKQLPKSITKEYFEKEVISVVESIFRNPLRIKAILYFIFYTGVRISELCRLRREDIDLEKRIVTIHHQKGKIEKLKPITKKVKELLEAYFEIELEGENAFNITPRRLQQICEKINPYLDLKNTTFHPHLLRHSFATHCRTKGIKIEDIQELMGHKNIQSTMIYAHTNIENIKRIYDEKIK